VGSSDNVFLLYSGDTSLKSAGPAALQRFSSVTGGKLSYNRFGPHTLQLPAVSSPYSTPKQFENDIKIRPHETKNVTMQWPEIMLQSRAEDWTYIKNCFQNSLLHLFAKDNGRCFPNRPESNPRSLTARQQGLYAFLALRKATDRY
jgi:hypothetical protein